MGEEIVAGVAVEEPQPGMGLYAAQSISGAGPTDLRVTGERERAGVLRDFHINIALHFGDLSTSTSLIFTLKE